MVSETGKIICTLTLLILYIAFLFTRGEIWRNPVHERGGSRFEWRQKGRHDSTLSHIGKQIGLGLLETHGIHPLVVRCGTRKQLAKHTGLSDWVKHYLKILNKLKWDHSYAQGNKGTRTVPKHMEGDCPVGNASMVHHVGGDTHNFATE